MVVSQKTASFPVFNQFLKDMKEVCSDDVHLVIKKHLASLTQEFDPIFRKRFGTSVQSICYRC